MDVKPKAEPLADDCIVALSGAFCPEGMDPQSDQAAGPTPIMLCELWRYTTDPTCQIDTDTFRYTVNKYRTGRIFFFIIVRQLSYQNSIGYNLFSHKGLTLLINTVAYLVVK